MDYFEAAANLLKPENGRAMVIIEERSKTTDMYKALAVLRKSGISDPDMEIVKDTYPAVILFRLDPEFLKDAVLKLSENGFNRLKAVSPKIDRFQGSHMEHS